MPPGAVLDFADAVIRLRSVPTCWTSTPLVNMSSWTTLSIDFAFQPLPRSRGGGDKFEHYRPGRVLRKRAFDPHCAMPNGREHVT